MGKKVLLIGLGMQGKAILYDLVNSREISSITVIDNRPDFQRYIKRYPSEKVSGRLLDVTDAANLSLCMRDADIVVEALPGPFSLPLGKLASECGVSLVSSMFYLNPGEQDSKKIQSIQKQISQMDKTAKEKGITILTEFGLDPGIDLFLGAKAIKEMDEVLEMRIYGAGIPGLNARTNPLKYKFSWSIMGVMDAYRRPARIISRGQVVTIEAEKIFEKENTHILEVEEIGTSLECYPNGDSVHDAELFGIRNSVKEMGRYTSRLPGHCAFWETVVKCGFLNEQPIQVEDVFVSPVQFTASLLSSQKQFHYADDEEDMTFVRVDVRGIKNGKRTRIMYQLIDTRDFKTGFTSMQRTVGFTMSLGARLILEKKLQKSGVLTPLDVPYESVIPVLETYDMHFLRRELPWL
jgi:saccharopine dehydrogenase-like NADP-dependent oxidoreductase